MREVFQVECPSRFRRAVAGAVLVPGLILPHVLTNAAERVDYLRDVKPILSQTCYRCHGVSQQKGGLRLDTARLAEKGGDSGPSLVRGAPDKSLLIQAVRGTHAEIPRMPYKKPPLNADQINLLARWVSEGAPAPEDEKPEDPRSAAARHWSFIRPESPAEPAVKNQAWPRNAIDRFILSRLEEKKIKPAPEADRVTLIRRLTLDLTGLLPSPAEVDAFVSDRRKDAYDRLVDRLLASQHYGERWGRHWLDVARYADSNGYSIDAPRSIWKYRDWVMEALNRDLPFDQFIIDQLAGDLLPGATLEQKIATGFHRNTQINQEGGIDPEQFRVESVIDRVNTTGTAFLGLTIGCAQCHDHKFDPITQRDYYQFFAFFNNTIEDGHGKGAPEGMLEIPGQEEAPQAVEKEREEAEEDLNRYLDTRGSELVRWEGALTDEQRAAQTAEVRKAIEIPFAKRSAREKRVSYAAFRAEDPEFKQRLSKLVRLEKRQPKPVTTLVMVERNEPRNSFILINGDFTRPGAAVAPGIPALFASNAPPAETSRRENAANPDKPFMRTRLDLARWIASPENPLTARVIVNRLWQEYFGRGLVETENDFGTQGLAPSHPELLDWLACELVRKNWSLKAIHRLLVTSATYRQSSRARPELALVDPSNRLLARQSRIRLDAEVVRDAGLCASGLLNEKVGGPGVFPPQPSGVMTLGQNKRDWKPSAGPDRYRRGMYTFYWRATPHPALAVFDEPDAFGACTRRIRSNTPLQALTLLNDEAFFEMAQSMAERVLREGGRRDEERIDLAFRFCLARHPGPGETQRLLDFLRQERRALEKNPEPAAKDAPSKRENVRLDAVSRSAWTSVCRVLLNLDETITRE